MIGFAAALDQLAAPLGGGRRQDRFEADEHRRGDALASVFRHQH